MAALHLRRLSAIPVSLLGFDETRQMGIGFLKNFAAACLAGAVMMFLFVAYPYVIAGLLPTDPSGGLMALDLLALAAAEEPQQPQAASPASSSCLSSLQRALSSPSPSSRAGAGRGKSSAADGRATTKKRKVSAAFSGCAHPYIR